MSNKLQGVVGIPLNAPWTTVFGFSYTDSLHFMFLSTDVCLAFQKLSTGLRALTSLNSSIRGLNPAAPHAVANHQAGDSWGWGLWSQGMWFESQLRR